MSSVTTAVVLAGGLGTRLRSVVSDVPKPMAPIHGKPFLAYELDYWIGQGIKQFVLSVGYMHTHIHDFFGEQYHGARIDYVIENTPLGPGGAFLKVLEHLHPKKPLLLLNGDTYYPVNLNKLSQFAVANQADLVFSMFYTEDKHRYMPMDVDSSGRVLAMPPGPIASDVHLANGGVYWVGPAACHTMLQKCPMRACTLDQDVFPMLFSANARLFGMICNEAFIDIGLPEDYARFQQQVTGMESYGS